MAADDHAREYLDYFLALGDKPGFAVMLEGPWGSGKSYFVEKYFEARAKAQAAADDDKDKMVHVSLFGVSSLDDIEAQLFEKANPWLGGKLGKTTNVVVSRLLGLIRVNANPDENRKLLQALFFNLDGRVVVFDDLERCAMPIIDVMGYINRYVEHSKVRVIVVASEADIPEGQREEYKRRKEKLVGKTVRVGSDTTSVLDALVGQLRLSEAKSAIAINREKLLTTFAAGTRPNFRSLRSALFDFERVAAIADERLRASSPAMGKLLLYTVALGLEYHSNQLDAEMLRAMDSSVPRSLFAAAGKDLTDRQKIGLDLRKRYELVSWDDPVVPPVYMADLFSKGSVDLDELNEFLGRHPAVVGQAATPSWRLMWAWYDLTETQYRTARAEFLRDLATRHFVQPGHILHAAGICLRLVRNRDRVFGSTSVQAYFKEYLADLEAVDSLVPAPTLFTFGATGYGGLAYNEGDNPGFIPLRTMVNAAAERALARWLRSRAPDLLARLQTDPTDASMLHEHGIEDGNYAGNPILHEIPIEAFADLALDDGNLNGAIFGALRARYNQGYGKELEPEFDWIIRLKAELLRRVSRSSPPFKAFNKAHIEYYFNDIMSMIGTVRSNTATARRKSTRRRKNSTD